MGRQRGLRWTRSGTEADGEADMYETCIPAVLIHEQTERMRRSNTWRERCRCTMCGSPVQVLAMTNLLRWKRKPSHRFGCFKQFNLEKLWNQT